MDNKLTDNGIIKALDWLVEQMGVCSSDDAYIYGHILLCHFNRQKAEIEELKEKNEKQRLIVEAIDDNLFPLPFETDFDKAIKIAKSEAIKEFAERLKERNRLYCTNVEDAMEMDFVIENLVKEFVKGDAT